jgi:hypothetical protein
VTAYEKRKGKRKIMQAVEIHSPNYSRKRSHFSIGYRKTPQPNEKEQIDGDQEGCRLYLKPAPDDS